MRIFRKNGETYGKEDFELSLTAEDNMWVNQDLDDLSVENKKRIWDELFFGDLLDHIYATQGIVITYQILRLRGMEEREENEDYTDERESETGMV